jgi:ABC-type glycerol-3-phosphate transport system substrate-binding protein
MTVLRSRRTRVGAAAFAAALVLAACGGGDDGSASSSGSTLASPPDEAELDPAADTVANQLPNVVVDDVGRGNKVNLRNLAPADTPILLWMWAPH